jgi:hypothetical protein
VLKLLLTLAVIVAVWYAFKSQKRANQRSATKLGRAVDAARQAMAESARAREDGARDVGGTAAGGSKPGSSSPPVDLHPCPKCGAYVAVGTACSCSQV